MLYKLSVLVFLISMAACNKEAFTYSKVDAFEELTESIIKYSASIDSRNINWDSLVMATHPNITQGLTEAEYFATIGSFLQVFRDPHVWLLAPFDSMYSIDNLGYTKNYEEAIVDLYVSDIEQHATNIKSGFINGDIGYLSCRDFKGDVDFNNTIYAAVIAKFKNTKGLIIDLRINDGGSVYNAQNLLNKLTKTRQLWHTTQNRTLTGFDEIYPW